MVRLLNFAAAALGALLLALEADAAFQSGDRFLTNTKDKLRRSHINILASTVEEAYFEDAVVDNFAPIQQEANATTWKQRYFINKQFYGGTGSPVFFFNGGESQLSGGWLTASSFIGKLAQKHGALLVGLEHRYYGLSTPTPDLSVDNLRYLSSEQQLADVARFHGYLTQTLGLHGAKWVTFGGSYAGSLAAWEKLKYPQLFAGAVASSGPLFAKTDFYEYNEVVGRSLRYFGGDACYDRLREGVEGFRKLVDGGDATRGELQKLFPACHPIQNELDQSVYESGVMYGIQGTVQYDDPATADIKNLCAQFTNTSKSAIEQLSSYTLSQFSNGCMDSTFEGNADGLVEFLSTTELNPDSYVRQWYYQTCNEFGWYQTATSKYEPFAALKAVTEFATGLEVCKRVFNLDARASVQRTNDFYGGLDLTVENVTFVSGSIDPWGAIAVSNETHLNDGSSSAVYIEGTSHCADMYGPRSTDIPALTAAHAVIGANVAKYIGAAP